MSFLSALDTVREPNGVVDDLSRAWAMRPTEVIARLRAVHRVVDTWITDDVAIWLDTLYLGDAPHPVLRALFEYIKVVDEEALPPEQRRLLSSMVSGALLGEVAGLTRQVGVPLDTVDRFPIAGMIDLLVAVADGHPDSWGGDDEEVAYSRLCDWVATYRGPIRPRRYDVAPAGPERDLETWLAADLNRIPDIGEYLTLDDPDSLVRRQPVLPDRRKPDLIVRVTADCDIARQGDLVVIELKATRVNCLVMDQILGYVGAVRALRPDTAVHGMLIADGRSLNLQRRLDEQGFLYCSLNDVGYRDFLRSSPNQPTTWDVTEGTAPVTMTTAGD